MKQRSVSVSIVAHVDHGKSTLCDRIIEICEGISLKCDNKPPVLDDHIIEKTRGITIRNHFVRLLYNETIINLIDTPGHYDFSKYVRIGASASDYIVLVVDITKGIQAQTICYMRMCRELDVQIILAINKVDAIDISEVESRAANIMSILSISEDDTIILSSKTGYNVDKLVSKIESCARPSHSSYTSQLKLLVMDVAINYYEGVVLLVKVLSGQIKIGDNIKIKKYTAVPKKMYIKTFDKTRHDIELSSSGDLCYLSFCSLQEQLETGMIIEEAGTSYLERNMFSPTHIQIVPKNNQDITKLKEHIIGLKNSDPAVGFYQHNSHIYGRSFLCSFIGELHKEIFIEKLKIQCGDTFSEFKPDIQYMFVNKDNTTTYTYYPDKQQITSNYRRYLQRILSPMCYCSLSAPCYYYDRIISLIMKIASINRVLDHSFYGDLMIMKVCIPYEIILRDFNSMLKSATEGMADCIIEHIKYEKHSLVLIEAFINNCPMDIFTKISLECTASYNAIELHDLIAKSLRKQQYEICLSVKINRVTYVKSVVKPYRKDVTGKCYGGDATRKSKLLKKQKAGKERLKELFSASKVVSNIVNSLKD